MAGKGKHPGEELISYVNGALTGPADRDVAAHLKDCPECDLLAGAIRAIKDQGRAPLRTLDNTFLGGVDVAGDSTPEIYPRSTTFESETPSAFDPYSKPGLPPLSSGGLIGNAEALEAGSSGFSGHPNAARLAAFFYEDDIAASRDTAAHVATCAECSSMVSEFASAEHAAAEYNPKLRNESLPAWVFKSINEWESNDFGKVRADSETLNEGLLNRLLGLLRGGSRELQDALERHLTRTRQSLERPGLVPVFVMSSVGETRGVELFRCSSSGSGSTLRHESESTRYNGRTLVAVGNPAVGTPALSVNSITGSSAHLGAGLENCAQGQLHYFIIED